MCSKRCRKVKDSFNDFDKSWEEEIGRLKHDIKKTEKKLSIPEHNKFVNNFKFTEGSDRSDNFWLRSSESSPITERMISTRKFSSHVNSREPKNVRNVQGVEKSGENAGIWVSPTVTKTRGTKYDSVPEPFGTRLESSFDVDCGSSVISLDFGLVSPKYTWSSPPQRIERAQNREWSSPHRVIDRPNPENSPGNWISMKESAAKHSPALVYKNQPVESPKFTCPEPEPNLFSDCTYVLPGIAESQEWHSQDSHLKRKVAVLEDYEPERVISTGRKRAGGPTDAIEMNLLPSNDKVRRVVDPNGHVIKISHLGDFETPAFSKTHDKTTDVVEKESGEVPDKPTRGTTCKVTKISTNLSQPVLKPQAKKKKEESKGVTDSRIQSVGKGSDLTEIAKTDQEKTGEESEDKEGLSKSTQKMIQDLKEILRAPNNDVSSPVKENGKEQKSKSVKKFKPCPAKPVDEKPAEMPEKRKRNVDPKTVQEYIKNQKQKRMEQVKAEKKTKDAEKEARKKKLEELRIKTLKLAAQSKKKKGTESTIKVVDPGTEDDITMSLGLKQSKPKVSFNESVLKLKKNMSQSKPSPAQPPEQPLEELETQEEKEEEEEEEDEKTLENVETIQVIEAEELKKPDETIQLNPSKDLNDTLKKLAESLHVKLDQQEKKLRSRPESVVSKSAKDPLSEAPSQETLRSVKSAPEQNRQVVTVDLEMIQTLKSDIKKISENFKVLHEIIVDKVDISGKVPEGESQQYKPPANKVPEPPQKEVPHWMKSVLPRVYPCNVLSALQKKMNFKTAKTPSTVSQDSSTFAEPISNKYDSEFEALSMPSDRLRSAKEISGSCETSEENYFSLKDDSGSEFSSSILDSEKQSLTSAGKNKNPTSSRGTRSKDSLASSVLTEISTRSIQFASSKGFDSTNSKSYYRQLSSERENLILVTPDLKLISNDLHQEKLNNHAKNLNVFHDVRQEELNNSEKSQKEQKTDSTITELINNLSENDKSGKSGKTTNGKPEKPLNVVQRIEEVHVRRSFFQPEMLHLQFQAELTLLETFQQSLSHFLEAERMKTLSEVNRIVYEKTVNSEKPVSKEDQAVQTSYSKETPEKTSSDEADSVKTEINVEESMQGVESDSENRELPDVGSEISEKLSTSSKETLKETPPKDLENSDYGSCHAGISFQMLDRIMKDEELRSEHQLALIRLREKTLNEKVKAELTFLEMKKRALKERGGDEEQNLSAIKKKQRGILLKYQSEKEEIERLKKMHKIASEERKIMIKQQKQIQQMQMSTKDIIIKLKKREKSPQKKAPLRPKALKSSGSQSEVPEDIPVVSDSLLSESAYSAEDSRHSSRTDLDLSSRSYVSEDDSEILRRNTKALHCKMSYSLENLKSKKSQLETEKHPRKRHSVEELLSWTKRLEEKENHLKELERQTNRAKSKLTKSVKSGKTSMKDRSTSPFQFQDSSKTISEVSPSERTEAKKSSTVSEAVETNSRTGTTEKTESVTEKIQSSASDDIPEQFSKKISISRTTEYYSESFESPSSSEAPKTKPEITRVKPASDLGHKGIAIKLSLSPRMQSPRRRYSSGSDDSMNLSHTETASEQSDLESRIAALHEQLRKRKLEAERLRREQKKAQRERLKVKEQSLLKQIQAYDAYIQKKKQELEQEYENTTQTIMKPQIKQPKVAEMSSFKRQEFVIQESDKLGLSPRFGAKAKEKEESTLSEKTPDKESDSEVSEQIKGASESVQEPPEESESIREELESKLKEVSKTTESTLEVENLTKESLKSSSASESLPEQDAVEESQSDSEDQSLSIKTTLLSPEKQDTDLIESPTGLVEDESQSKKTADEDVYQLDSFESDAEEKATAESENAEKSFESVEAAAEVRSESGVSEVIEEMAAEEESAMSEERNQKKSEKAEKMADSIIMGLILESLNVFCSKKAEAERKLAEKSKLSLEALSSYLAREIISEAVDDMIKIYNRKDEKGGESPEGLTSDVRRRITEIMSQVGGARESRRPQDLMVMTHDVSPAGTPPPKEGDDSTEQERFLQSLTPSRRERKAQGQVSAEGEEGKSEESKAEVFGQEWIDDDFGLSQTRREAEELRLQQLQIEQEIQQLQAQQEQVPYFYLREIPNKPPPPYTPPGKPLSEIPTSESDVMSITLSAVRILMEEINKGREIAEVEPSWDFYGDAGSEHLKCYKFFLFDLAKHIIWELLKQQERKTEVLPWMRTREQLSKFKYRKVERTPECLSEYVEKQVSILFGFGRKVSKESLIVRWIKKKRDHVDEILVGESQEEEAQWTRYDEDQVTVKNEVAVAILDGLLEDTARVVNAIVSNKTKKEK